MKDNYEQINITDLASAVQTKTSQEVTSDFVKAATSYILSVCNKGGQSDKPLWDLAQMQPGQYLS